MIITLFFIITEIKILTKGILLINIFHLTFIKKDSIVINPIIIFSLLKSIEIHIKNNLLFEL